MKYTLTSLALAAASLASPVPDYYPTAPSSFKINDVSYGGSGCPQGSLDVYWTDSRLLPIRFGKDFTAKTGAGVDVTNNRKNCQLALSISNEPGFSYSVYQADFSGWADLDDGVSGRVKSNYYYSGEADQTSSAISIDGPFHDRYTKQDTLEIAKWSPCGGSSILNINTMIDFNPSNSGKSGVLGVTRESGRFTNNLYVQWKKC